MRSPARTVTLELLTEARPGGLWKKRFRTAWPHYRSWLEASEWSPAESATAARRRLALELPELLPTYEALCALAGDDEEAHRFLALYRPPPFLAGCSALATAAPEPLLVRNYDYRPDRWEGTVWRTNWRRPVLAAGDCLWGALDGINADGLAVALVFGGRRVVGDGFGIPLLVRFLLETCGSVADCRAAVPRLRSHMAYSLLVADPGGDRQVIHLAPDRAPRLDPRPYLSNFQGAPEWPEYARATRAVERFERLAALEATESGEQGLGAAFRLPPLASDDFEHSFGTLYTATYRPVTRSVHYQLPDESFEFEVGTGLPADKEN